MNQFFTKTNDIIVIALICLVGKKFALGLVTLD